MTSIRTRYRQWKVKSHAEDKTLVPPDNGMLRLSIWALSTQACPIRYVPGAVFQNPTTPGHAAQAGLILVHFNAVRLTFMAHAASASADKIEEIRGYEC